MNPIAQFTDAWNDPSMRHAMLVHFPIVLSLVGLIFTFIAAITWSKCKMFRCAALAIFIIMLGCGYIAEESGENAHDAVEGSLSEEGEALLHEHEELGEKVWIFSGISLLLVVGSFVPKAKIGRSSAWLAVLGSMWATGWVANTADHGGRLVYEFGAGTPDQFAEIYAMGNEDAEPAGDPRLTFFRNEVKPILAKYCWKCHNAKNAGRSGQLNQMSIANLLVGGESGEPCVVPGSPSESMLILKVLHEDKEERMPPMGKALTEDQIKALERWIAQGAVWESPLAAKSNNDEASNDSHDE